MGSSGGRFGLSARLLDFGSGIGGTSFNGKSAFARAACSTTLKRIPESSSSVYPAWESR